jgi:predicted O-linked N-acetylglucosamine transferase (SPINDLY family)
VFCSFNNSYKYTPDVFDVWMSLLRNVDGSVLWLLDGAASSSANLRREAQARNVAPERLVFAPRVSPDDHLARHRHADLFLDTLPYNAHTTTGDALWTGLPVVTCLGAAFAGRVAGSQLKAIGLPELVTQSLEDYEALALRIARDPAALAPFKTKLANNRLTAPLFDTARSTRDIEAAYVTMWQRQQNGLSPETFEV